MREQSESSFWPKQKKKDDLFLKKCGLSLPEAGAGDVLSTLIKEAYM